MDCCEEAADATCVFSKAVASLESTISIALIVWF